MSSLTGLKYGKVKGSFKFFKGSKLAKGLDTFVKGGLSANAWDFAYTDWKKYRKKNIGDHIKLFAAGYFWSNRHWMYITPSNYNDHFSGAPQTIY